VIILNIEGKVGIHNKFEIEKVNTQTGEVENYEAYNMIVDAMWTRLCARNTYFNTIVFGSGTGTLSTARTTLFTAMGSKSVTHVSRNYILSTPTPISWKQKIVLLPEEYQNTSIAEVGIGHTTTSIVTHALIKDSEGNPIAVSKGLFDQITIYATVYITLGEMSYGNTEWWGLNMGNSINFDSNTLVRYLLGEATSLNGVYFASPAQSQIGFGTSSSAPTLTADNANKKIVFSTVRYATTSANNESLGIKHFSYGETVSNNFRRIFSSKLPITSVFDNFNITNESIGVGDGISSVFEFDFSRIKENTQVIKVDGVTKIANIDYSIIESNTLGVARLFTASNTLNTLRGTAISNDGMYLAAMTSVLLFIFLLDPNTKEPTFQTTLINHTLTSTSRYDIIFNSDDTEVLITGFSTGTQVYSFDKNTFTLGFISSTGTGVNTSYTSRNRRSLRLIRNESILLQARTTSSRSIEVVSYPYNAGIIGSQISTVELGGLGSNDRGTLIEVSHDENRLFVGSNGSTTGMLRYNISETGVFSGAVNVASIGDIFALKFIFNHSYLVVGQLNSIKIYDYSPITYAISNARTLNISAGNISEIIVDETTSDFMVIGSSIKCFNYNFTTDTMTMYPDVEVNNITALSANITPEGNNGYKCLYANGGSVLGLYQVYNKKNQIQFTTPPALNAVITADYSVDYIPKDSNHVLDIGFSIQFADGNVV
jgi:hypothetical protein